MATKITREVIEAYLDCKHKGFIMLTGHQGAKTEYELLLKEARAAYHRSGLKGSPIGLKGTKFCAALS